MAGGNVELPTSMYEVFATIDIEFFDPHAGAGGWGASAAQFLMCYAVLAHIRENAADGAARIDIERMLATFVDVAWDGRGFPPSGADIVAQLEGGLTITPENFIAEGDYVALQAHGDSRTKSGGTYNNTYCQDNELNWLSWEHNDEQNELLEFTRKLIQLRRDHPVFRRPKFFQGRRIRGSEIRDVMWFNPGGNEMSDEEWGSPFVRCIGVLLSGDTIDVLSFEGEPIRDETFLLLVNAHHEPISFVLPGEEHLEWQLILDTEEDRGFLREPKNFPSGDDVEVIGRGLKLLKLATGAQARARHELKPAAAVQQPPPLPDGADEPAEEK